MLSALMFAAAASRAPAQDVPAPPPSETISLLEVHVNGWPLNLVARFIEGADGRLSLPAEQYDGLGFKLDETLVTLVDGQRRVFLEDVRGLSYSIDQRAQTIAIEAPFAVLAVTPLRIDPAPERVESRADWGLLLGYDAWGEWSAEPDDVFFGRVLSTNLEARLFSPRFTARTLGQYTMADGEKPSYVRLDSWVDIDNPEATRRLRIGDSLTGGPFWARPIRFGGVQWGTNFGLRPDIITTPMPSLREDISAPSSIDVFINDVRRADEDVDPGSFLLTDLPLTAGANSIRVVVEDAAGRRTEAVLPLYSSPSLLAPGLSEYLITAGSARRDYGFQSNAYEGAFASASYRRGLTDALTLGGQIEVAEDYASAAAGARFTVADAFLALFAVGASQHAGTSGGVWWAGVERTVSRYTFAASYMSADDGYRDLAAAFDYGRYVRLATVSAGVSTWGGGNLNATYILQENPDIPVIEAAAANFTQPLFDDRINIMIAAQADLGGEGWSAQLSLRIPLGRHARATAKDNLRDGERQYQSLELRGDAFDQKLDWGVAGYQGEYEGAYAEATWQGVRADLYGEVATVNDSSGARAQVAQSLILMGGGLHLAGRVDDAFTVVDVEDSPGVNVFLENRPIGRTDRHGRLMVNDLQAYTGNAISIDPQDLPLNAEVGDVTTLTAPREGSGVFTRFEVSHERAALLTLRLPSGEPPPIGASARIDGAEGRALVGYDGELYVRGLALGTNRLTLSWNGAVQCAATFEIPNDDEALPRIGPLTCAP